MTDSKTQAIAAIIKKLEKLKKAKEEYWSDVTDHIIEEVLLDLVDVEDYIVEHSRPGDYLGGILLIPTGADAFTRDLMCDIQYAVKSPKRKDTNTLIRQLKIVEKRAEKAREHKPESTEELATDTLTGQESLNETGEVDKNKTSDKKELTWQANVIALALDHRDWSVQKIADTVGRTRQALYKDKDLGDALKARNQQKRSDKSHLPNGEKDSKTGKLEAWK